jgi:hypothetical protein
MNFGFVTGDAWIAEPYFYATAYPMPPRWRETALPHGAYWQTEGFTGSILPYARLAPKEMMPVAPTERPDERPDGRLDERPDERLYEWLTAAHASAKQWMNS